MGLSYANDIKANVLFFNNKPASPDPWTKEIWVYDYRTNIHHTLKKKPLRLKVLRDFITLYNPQNRHKRSESWSEETLKECGVNSAMKSLSGTRPTSTSSGSKTRVWLTWTSSPPLLSWPAKLYQNIKARLESLREIMDTIEKE